LVLCFFNDSETSKEGLSCFFIDPQLVNCVLAGNEKLLWADEHGRLLDLGDKGLVICPIFEERTTPGCDVSSDIVEQDDVFALISIPPLVAHLSIGMWIGAWYGRISRHIAGDGGGLSTACLAMYPETTGGGDMGDGGHVILSDSFDGGVVLDTYFGGDIFDPSFFAAGPDLFPVFRGLSALFFVGTGSDAEFEEVSIFGAVRDVLLGRACRYNDVDPPEGTSQGVELLGVVEVEISLEVLRVRSGGFFVAIAVISGAQAIEDVGVVIRVVVPRKGEGSGSLGHKSVIFMIAYKDRRRELLYTPVRGGGAEAVIKVRGGVSPPLSD